jgi:CDP-diacylglycerol pyrophosphatase
MLLQSKVLFLFAALSLALASQAAGVESDRGALWRVVQSCVADHALTGAAFPCLDINLSGGRERGYVVLRRPLANSDLILAPTTKMLGVEDPRLQSVEAPNYFQDAWSTRVFLTPQRKMPLAHDDVALAVNSRGSRSQDQLHIHIGCLSRETKQTLASLALQLPEYRWVRIGQPVIVGNGLHEAGLWGRRVAGQNLAEVNPIRLATEAHPSDSEMRAHTMIVVAGVELALGRDGFVLLASQGEPSGSGNQAYAEDFLDGSCSS